ncbi:hypothetical protein SKAU_G00338450 [Synaphobranchus kaupii]|uniref:Uncharacterized protein n=1 Tax=Synaphobranchus kaupii TaxID=118154 RepID=A0A9Q1EMG8_SYNKA|nr:hypothetical protein SKAU_G00338450 [Synaphobranchus kaupii]
MGRYSTQEQRGIRQQRFLRCCYGGREMQRDLCSCRWLGALIRLAPVHQQQEALLGISRCGSASALRPARRCSPWHNPNHLDSGHRYRPRSPALAARAMNEREEGNLAALRKHLVWRSTQACG